MTDVHVTVRDDGSVSIQRGTTAMIEPTPVLKAVDEQRYVLGVAYQPGRDPRIAKGIDGGRDYFTEAELEKAAWTYLQDGGMNVGLSHADGTEGAAKVVESYVYRGPDWVIKAIDGEDVVVKTGSWLVGAILDEHSWAMYKAGRITGISPQGTGTRRRTRSIA